MKIWRPTPATWLLAGALSATLLMTWLVNLAVPLPEATCSFIVEGADVNSAAVQVGRVGGVVTQRLPVIHAVGAELTLEQLERLRTSGDGLKLFVGRGGDLNGGAGLSVNESGGGLELRGSDTTASRI